MPFLLDTNLISETTKPRPNRKVLSWLMAHAASSFVSSITLGEMWSGIQRMPRGRKKNEAVNWFAFQEDAFAESIISPDWQVMRTWGDYSVRLSRSGRRVPLFDSLIAATALTHNLTIATRNIDDFPEVDVFNPWD